MGLDHDIRQHAVCLVPRVANVIDFALVLEPFFVVFVSVAQCTFSENRLSSPSSSFVQSQSRE